MSQYRYAEWTEGVGIAVAVCLAAFVSTYSEHKNESNFQSLQVPVSECNTHMLGNCTALVPV
jgi:hypothetical protein